uniref:CCR4-NOT transcription complex subunit 11 n=1 Tax=Haptolina ericina TaxID=156174 RepID=A0A7S3FGD3_9EUKA|mmetsp:Transcript_67629/g.150953  ORF Transcript_67629/g.150953 Transcript_67629/m.150953 type:complete len:404 (+) Transcript_67629:89-1300(+)
MLTQKETVALLEILGNEDKSLETAAGAFQRAFVRADHFRVAAAMCIMFDDNLMPSMHRCVALFIIYELYKNEPPGVHPFMPFLVDMAQVLHDAGDSSSLHERNLLCMLLSASGAKEVSAAKKTPAELVAMWKPGAEQLPLPPLSALRASYADRDAQVPELGRVGISPLVADPQPLELPLPEADSEGGEGAQGLGGLEQALSLLRLEPQLLRPPPPLLDSRDDEVLWLNPHSDNSFEVLWDFSMCADNVKGAEVRELMCKAFRGPLVPGQQQQVLAELESDAKLVYHCGLTPKRLPDLVENNPVIAIEVLLKLMSSSQITDYFSVLVNMDISLHSMEVVNRLTTAVDLPTEFVHLYISNCISSCENIKDRYMQNRLVRPAHASPHAWLMPARGRAPPPRIPLHG